MGLLCCFILEPIDHNNHIIRIKACLLFAKFKIGNWEQGWSQVSFLNMETHAIQFYDKGGIANVICHIKSAIFIAKMFHTIVKTSWIIFDLHQQFFCWWKHFWIRKAGWWKKKKLSFYLIIVLREENQVQFELLTKIF